MNNLLTKYKNIFAVLSEVKDYVGVESIGFSNEFMGSLDFMLDEINREIEALNIVYENNEEKRRKEKEMEQEKSV